MKMSARLNMENVGEIKRGRVVRGGNWQNKKEQEITRRLSLCLDGFALAAAPRRWAPLYLRTHVSQDVINDKSNLHFALKTLQRIDEVVLSWTVHKYFSTKEHPSVDGARFIDCQRSSAYYSRPRLDVCIIGSLRRRVHTAPICAPVGHVCAGVSSTFL